MSDLARKRLCGRRQNERHVDNAQSSAAVRRQLAGAGLPQSSVQVHLASASRLVLQRSQRGLQIAQILTLQPARSDPSTVRPQALFPHGVTSYYSWTNFLSSADRINTSCGTF